MRAAAKHGFIGVGFFAGFPAPVARTVLKMASSGSANFTFYLPGGPSNGPGPFNTSRCNVLFGGGNRQSDFIRAGVRRGDTVYLITIAKKRLHLLSRMVVVEIEDTGVTQIVRGALGARIHRDLVVPPAMLERWRYAGGKKERAPRFVADGEVTRANAFHGVYRLTPATASELFGLILEHEARQELTDPGR